MSDTEYVIIVIGCLMMFIGGMLIGYNDGQNVGLIQAASGQYECTLEEQSDKTTEWKCEEVS